MPDCRNGPDHQQEDAGGANMIMTRACEKCLRIFQCYDGVKHSCSHCNQCHIPEVQTIVTGLCPRCQEEYANQKRTEAAKTAKAQSKLSSEQGRRRIGMDLSKGNDKKADAAGGSEQKAVLQGLCRKLLNRI